MYKITPIPLSLLTATFLRGSNILPVSPELYGAMSTQLAPGDWTYLIIKQNGKAEVVRAIGVLYPSSLVVARKADNTEEHNFIAGATVEFVDTMAAVLDSFIWPEVQLSGLGAIQVSSESISYADIKITVSAASEVFGDDSKLTIGAKANAYGCCK